MDFFNYFIKTFIRFFTRKFFWVILIIITLLLGFIVFSPTSFGAENNNIEFWLDGEKISAPAPFNISDNNPYALLYADSTGEIFLFRSNGANDSGIYIQNSWDYFYFWQTANYGGRRNVSLYKYDKSLNAFNYISNSNSISQNSNFNWTVGNTTFQCLAKKKIVMFIENTGVNNAINVDLPIQVPPYIVNASEVNSFSFNNLLITSGSVTNSSLSRVVVEMNVNGNFYTKIFDSDVEYLKKYIKYNSDYSFLITIPISYFTERFSLRDFDVVQLNLWVGGYRSIYYPSDDISTGDMYTLGSYTLGLSESAINYLNQTGQVARDNALIDSQERTNDLLSSSEVDDVDMGSLSNGITADDVSGLEQVFQILYNAFCTDTIQSISLTVPFTNNQFTIDTSNISNNFPSAIRNIVSVFVWGVIGLWVLKDIRSITNKIAEGSPENVGSDVKKEVL